MPERIKSQRRRELAEFLRSRRERLKPETVGIPAAVRRRTPGLRREEVADLANVGATWYTWLEQARDIQPSDDVLERLARALRLDAAETEHLFALSGRAGAVARGAELAREVPPLLKRWMHEFVSCPALALNRRWDILAANAQAIHAFPTLRGTPEESHNWLRIVFAGTTSRDYLVDWERNARRILAEFRLSIAGYLDAPWAQELVDDLTEKSAEFRVWWAERAVRDLSTTEFEILEPSGPAISYDRLVMFPIDGDGIRLVLYTPK